MLSIDVLKNFRAEFNLSQEDLSKLLNTSRSQINLFEKNLRPMPVDAQICFWELKQKIDAGTKDVASKQALASANDFELELARLELKDRLESIQFETAQISRQLQNIVEEHATITDANNKLSEILAVLPPDSLPAQMLSNKKRLQIKKLSSCNEAAQLRLRIKKDLLLAEADVISQYLGEGAS